MPRHPKTCEEGDGKLEHESRDVRRKSDETEVKDLAFEDEMVEEIIQHPLQNQVESTAYGVTEQLQTHHLAEWRIEEVDDRGQGAFGPGFYVFEG